jgi:hypothetical protein
MIYSRLNLDPVRASVESAAQAMLQAGKAKVPRRLLPAARTVEK